MIEVVSSPATTRGKTYVVTHYKDEQCSKRGKTDRIYKKKYAKDAYTFKPYVVDTSSNFIFQVAYTEDRRTEVRRCTAISNVALQAGRSYKAVFEVVDQVVGCSISVFDVTDSLTLPEPVLVVDNKPELMCEKVGKPGYKSGTPVYSYKDRLG